MAKRAHGEGHIKQRSNGLWETTIMVGYQEDGRRKRKSFYGKSQKEVRDKVKEFNRQQAMGLTIDPDVLFKDWAGQWFESHKDKVAATTYETYRYSVEILKDYFGKRKLRTIKPIDVDAFIKSMREDGKSDAYIAKARALLYQIMHKAEANDLIIKNPVRFAEKFKRSAPVNRKEAFTPEEVKILMKELPQDRIGHTIRLMLATGLRGQEMVALQPEHIEPDGSVIYVRQAVKMVKGVASIGDTKSDGSTRDVPVPESVLESAKFLREEAKEFVWTGRKPGQPFNLRNFRKHFMAALEPIEGVRKLTPHSCRHTYVTYLQTLGVDTETIRSIVGHADVDMTAHYIHVQEQSRKKAVKKLSRDLSR